MWCSRLSSSKSMLWTHTWWAGAGSVFIARSSSSFFAFSSDLLWNLPWFQFFVPHSNANRDVDRSYKKQAIELETINADLSIQIEALRKERGSIRVFLTFFLLHSYSLIIRTFTLIFLAHFLPSMSLSLSLSRSPITHVHKSNLHMSILFLSNSLRITFDG